MEIKAFWIVGITVGLALGSLVVSSSENIGDVDIDDDKDDEDDEDIIILPSIKLAPHKDVLFESATVMLEVANPVARETAVDTSSRATAESITLAGTDAISNLAMMQTISCLESEGSDDGCEEGCLEGCDEGCLVGCIVGKDVEGSTVGCELGWPDG
jgi:hypothetical protein